MTARPWLTAGRAALLGTALGGLVGLVVGLLDGGAFAAWGMLLGAVAGCVTSAAGATAWLMARVVLRGTAPALRRRGAAAAAGLGAAGTFLLLADRASLIAPWPAVGAAGVLAVAAAWAYVRAPDRPAEQPVSAARRLPARSA